MCHVISSVPRYGRTSPRRAPPSRRRPLPRRRARRARSAAVGVVASRRESARGGWRREIGACARQPPTGTHEMRTPLRRLEGDTARSGKARDGGTARSLPPTHGRCGERHIQHDGTARSLTPTHGRRGKRRTQQKCTPAAAHSRCEATQLRTSQKRMPCGDTCVMTLTLSSTSGIAPMTWLDAAAMSGVVPSAMSRTFASAPASSSASASSGLLGRYILVVKGGNPDVPHHH